MVPARIRDAVLELHRRCTERFGERVERVVLFGSYARGTPGPDSDVDVLVVVRGLSGAERSELYGLGGEVWMDTGVPVAPLALSEAEHAELRRLERRIVDDIDREGIPL